MMREIFNLQNGSLLWCFSVPSRPPHVSCINEAMRHVADMRLTPLRNLSIGRNAWWKQSLASLLEIAAFILILAATWYIGIWLIDRYFAI